MDEKMWESLSALMDDEANELEVKRLLTKGNSEQVMQRWKRYHLIGDAVRQGDRSRSFVAIDVSEEVSRRIADLEMKMAQDVPEERKSDEVVVTSHRSHTDEAALSRKTVGQWWRHVAGVAVFVLVAGGMFKLGSVHEPEAVVVPSGVAQHAIGEGAGANNVTFTPYQVNARQAEKLGNMMLHHAGAGFMASGQDLVAYARVANYNPQAL